MREEVLRRYAPTLREQNLKHGFIMDVMLPDTLIKIYQLHFNLKSAKESEKRMSNLDLTKLFMYGAAGIKGRVRTESEQRDLESAANESEKVSQSSTEASSKSSSTSHSQSSLIDNSIGQKEDQPKLSKSGSEETTSQSSHSPSPTRQSKIKPSASEGQVASPLSSSDVGMEKPSPSSQVEESMSYKTKTKPQGKSESSSTSSGSVKRPSARVEESARQEASSKIPEKGDEKISPSSSPRVQGSTRQEASSELPGKEDVNPSSNYGNINTDGANVGDVVIVDWSEEHNSFVVQFSSSSSNEIHFLHPKSVDEMALNSDASGARLEPFVVFVLKKVHYKASKSENRFNIAKGTEFYRVFCCHPEDGERRLEAINAAAAKSRAPLPPSSADVADRPQPQERGGRTQASFREGYIYMIHLERTSREMFKGVKGVPVPYAERKEYVSANLNQYNNGHKFYPLPEYQLPRISRKSGLKIDGIAIEAITRDNSDHTFLLADTAPVETRGNGSCFYNSMSVGLYGHDGYAKDIQFITAMNLMKRIDKYKKTPQNHVIELVTGDNDDSVFLEACRKHEPSSPRHIQACADGLNVKIILMTPKLGNPQSAVVMSDYELEGWNQIFTPLRAKTQEARNSLPVVTILFHYSGGVINDYRPNHFVPVLPHEPEERQSARATLYPDKTSSDSETQRSNRTGSFSTSSDKSSVPEVVIAKGKKGPKSGVISIPKVLRKLREETIDGEEIPPGLELQQKWYLQSDEHNFSPQLLVYEPQIMFAGMLR